MEQIKCENITLGYNGRAVLEHLSFKFESGDYLCILGENGSGKTTLMKTILGMKSPMSGTVEFLGGLRSKEIGYLPQQTDVQKDFPASVWEIVLSGCQSRKGNRPWYNKEEKNIAKYNIAKLEIENLINKSYSSLSGGQQQRVLLARALCATQKLILLDEPTTGLDPGATTDMYEWIKTLNQDGVGVIMISHDMEAALKYGKHILSLGKNTFFGTTEEYIDFARKIYEEEAKKVLSEKKEGGFA